MSKYNRILIIMMLIVLSITCLTVNTYATIINENCDNVTGEWTLSHASVDNGRLRFTTGPNYGFEIVTVNSYSKPNQFYMSADITIMDNTDMSVIQYILCPSSGGSYGIMIYPYGKKIAFDVYASEQTLKKTYASMPNGTTYNIGLGWNGTYAKLYIDGEYIGQQSLGNVNGNSGGTYKLRFSPTSYTYGVPTRTYYIDNILYTDESSVEPVFTSITNFNGYVKDDNGNSIQYANVSLWNNDITYINSVLTDSSGYYNFTSTINLGESHDLRVVPPNKGISNYYNFTLNSASETVTHNFTVTNLGLVLQAYDKNDANVYLTEINVNYTINGVWYNSTSVNNPYGVPQTLSLTDNLDIYIGADGYYYYHTGINSLQSGQTVITAPLIKNNSIGSYIYVQGYVRDNIGTIIGGNPVKVYLKNTVTNSIIDSGMTNDYGFFALKVPKVNANYNLIVDYPSYGNQTAHLHYYSSTFEITDDIIIWPDTWTSPNGQTNNNPNTPLNIDALLELVTYTPSVTVTPTPFVPPTGYSTIYGYVYDNTSSGYLANVNVGVLSEDGQFLFTATTDANGRYSITFLSDSITAQTLLIYPANSSYYDNYWSYRYIPYPFPSGKSYNVNLPLYRIASVPDYVAYGYVYDESEHTKLANVVICLNDSNGNTIVTTKSDGNGYYELHIPHNVTPATYNLTCYLAGFGSSYVNNFYVPEVFLFSNPRNYDLGIVPDNFNNDNNNEIMLRVTDKDTGLSLRYATYTLRYNSNNTIAKQGSLSGQYWIYITDIIPDTYKLVVGYTGYDSVTNIITVEQNSLYEVDVALSPTAIITPYPTATPIPTASINPSGTPTVTPTEDVGPITMWFNMVGITDTAIIALLKGVILIGVCTAITGGLGAATGNQTLTLLLGAVGLLGGVIGVCALNIWPWWIIAGIIILTVFLYTVYRYLFVGQTGNGGGE